VRHYEPAGIAALEAWAAQVHAAQDPKAVQGDANGQAA
jgi:hypothetical protein